jgi:nicotinamidase/pyrazinamidase
MNNKILYFPGGQVPFINVVSLDVDAQKGFTPICPNELPVSGGETIAGELNRQANFANKRAASKDAHSPHADWVATEEHPQLEAIEGQPDMDVRWNMHTPVGELGHELIPGLPHMRDYDFWAIKGTENDMHPYGACYQDIAKKISTGLIEWAMVNKVKVFLVGGLALEFCVKETVLELLDAGFVVILNLAATRGIFDDMIKSAIEEMKAKGAIIIDSVEELELV